MPDLTYEKIQRILPKHRVKDLQNLKQNGLKATVTALRLLSSIEFDLGRDDAYLDSDGEPDRPEREIEHDERAAEELINEIEKEL